MIATYLEKRGKLQAKKLNLKVQKVVVIIKVILIPL
jgi:hypothetical protein